MIRRDLKFDNMQNFTSGSITRLRNFGLPEVKKLPASSRVIACKRDPRSLIVSCTDYHMRGSEAWTQVPREKFDGKSYCQLLRDAATDEDRLIISMENKAGEIVKRLGSLADSDDVFFVSLEDLSRDESCSVYYDICEYMQLCEADFNIMFNHLKRESLWYMRQTSGEIPSHSTSGVSDTYIARLNGVALARYTELFGDLHIKLGYQQG